MISQNSIEEIKSSVRLVDVVGERVQLTRRGSNFTGLCPFHAEKSPSFSVNESGNFYHCFGCGESGNVISWYMKTQGLSFPEALEYIAEHHGITLQYEGKQKQAARGPDKKSIYSVNMAAYKFYRAQLDRAPKVVKDYLVSRKLEQEVCDFFGVGFATTEWRNLVDYLTSKKFSTELILAAALAKRNRNGELYDTFRGRVIFPIWVDGRKIAGFGGRIVPGLEPENDQGQQAKYINSPETSVYQKSSIFYGLPQALESIRSSKVAIIVEGYLDVIALQRVGISNVIATCGTALTSEHVKRLKSLVHRVILLFDGDNAGRQAAAKSFKTFLNSGIDVKALFLPEKDDPDSIADKHGVDTFQYISKLPTQTLLACYCNHLLIQHGFESFANLAPASKGRFATELAELIKTVENQVERDELNKEISFLLKIDQAEFEKLLDNRNSKLRLQSNSKLPDQQSNDASEAHSRQLLNRQVKCLNKIERDLLYAVMVLKSELPELALKDPLLAQEISPVVLIFIEALKDIVDSVHDQNVKKEQIKQLLVEQGQDWLIHWKEAYQMAANSQVDMMKLFQQCRSAIKRRKFEDAVQIAQRQIDETRDEELREFLVAQKIELVKQSKAVFEPNIG